MQTEDGGRWTEVLLPFVLGPLSLALRLPSSALRLPSALAHSQSAPLHLPKPAWDRRCLRIGLGIPTRGARARSPTPSRFLVRALHSHPSPRHGSEGMRCAPRSEPP